MRLDSAARLERLLQRHPDAMIVGPEPEHQTVVRRDEVLASAQDVPMLDDLLRMWVAGREDGPGVVRFHLRPKAKVDVCELVADLSTDRRHRRLALSPNHLLHGEPLWWGGPADVPRPAPAPETPRAGAVRREVTIALLDTGLSAHPWWEDTEWFREQRDGVAEVLDADLDYELDAQAGHGTFIAGVLLQQAPSVRLRVYRVLTSDGICDELDLVRALDDLHSWSVRTGQHVDLVNLSLGCYSFDDRPSPVIARAISRFGRRTVVVSCAGNNASDRPFWPAALKSVTSVAALDHTGSDRAWFSNYGWWVDACTAGEHVTSSFVHFDGPRPPMDGVDPDLFTGYASWSGTSFAAPRVAGAIAQHAATEGMPAAAAADEILDTADGTTLPDLGVVVRANETER